MNRGITKLTRAVHWLTGIMLATLLPVVALLLAAPPATAQLTTTTTHLDSDAFGNIILATDEQGNVLWRERYQPYGATRINQASKTNPVNLANPQDRGANSLGFHGKEADAATGLSYFGARYYDPLAGRFMGTDAVRFDPANPHSFNRYAYGNGNPYKYKDPDGNLPVLAPLLLAARALWVARGAQLAVTGAEIAAGDALGGAGVAVGAAAGAKAAGKAIDAAKDVTLSHRLHGEAAKHVEDAIRAGKPDVLTIDRAGAAANRKASTGTFDKVSGKHLDEYPPAMFREGGVGASVRPIQPRDNMSAGACIGNACRGLSDGTQVRIKVGD